MTPSEKTWLRGEINVLYRRISDSIKVLDDKAKELDISTQEMQLSDGSYPLSSLLCAQAQLLNTLALLDSK
jgi:hypothetical protein